MECQDCGRYLTESDANVCEECGEALCAVCYMKHHQAHKSDQELNVKIARDGNLFIFNEKERKRDTAA
jgi:NMD protein affecting ribosome stability and mRNA decay